MSDSTTRISVMWTTVGPVCGPCGHSHRTAETAQRCAERHQRDVKRGHGPRAYSDRIVVEVHQRMGRS